MTESLVTIPLSKLRPAQGNVRKTDAAAGLEELAASIAAHGVLQSLAVRPVVKPNGEPSDKYEVVAGCRRLAALKLLAKRKQVAKSYPVPCQVLAAEGDAVEVSLAENVVRMPMHPADQFEAFAKLREQGFGVEDIAARFGASPTVVRQRLKLAAVSPRLMEVYRSGEMSLEQLMAFTVSDDHEAQERVWFDSPYYEKQPNAIRRALTAVLVEGGDRRARFIGAEAYEAAGGTIIRDLFRPDDEGYFADSQLLDRLVAEKLAGTVEEIKTEGWSWVEVMPELDYADLSGFRYLPPEELPRSEEEQARLQELADRHDALVAEHGEDPPEEVWAEICRLSDEIDVLSQPHKQWSPEDMARGGALVTLNYHGGLHVVRGLLKPTPRGEEPETAEAGDEKDGGRSGKSRGEERGKSEPGLSEVMVQNLTAHRTAALRETLAGQPELALTALVHTLVLRFFYDRYGRETCLDISADSPHLKPFAENLGESRAVQALADRHRRWQEVLPAKDEGLWEWLTAQDLQTKLELLAYCTAVTLDAVRRRQDGEWCERLDHADILARAAGLDMADWWEASRDSYLGRVPKAAVGRPPSGFPKHSRWHQECMPRPSSSVGWCRR